jgi:hypothetical protein
MSMCVAVASFIALNSANVNTALDVLKSWCHRRDPCLAMPLKQIYHPAFISSGEKKYFPRVTPFFIILTSLVGFHKTTREVLTLVISARGALELVCA